LNAFVQVELDWRAYFFAFQAEHGGDPVMYGNRLLFRDGWRYSATDYAGPEWAPPEDKRELLLLRTAYWLKRLSMVKTERELVSRELKALAEMQAVRSAKLQQVVRFADEDGCRRQSSVQVDFDPLLARFKWLEGDIADCEQQLKELNDAD